MMESGNSNLEASMAETEGGGNWWERISEQTGNLITLGLVEIYIRIYLYVKWKPLKDLDQRNDLKRVTI